MTFNNDVEAVNAFGEKIAQLKSEIAKIIIGQDEVINALLNGIFSQGHCLLIGVPGLAKTLMVSTLAKVMDISYNRIQFTPDLMPSDIIGTEILNKQREFFFNKGPVFAHIILADEINRTPPKTQSALLEAMQEREVTVAGNTYPLPKPFFVLATQNPIEQEGTYPLPEAQLDRFMFNIWLDYPSMEEEVNIVKATTVGIDTLVDTVLTAEEIIAFQQLVRKIPVTDNVYEFAVNLAGKTRPHLNGSHPMADNYLAWGAGPRASQYLIIGAKCNAAMQGKYSPDIEDVKKVAVAVLRHRIVLNYKAEAENINVEDIVEEMMKT
ncbi:MAG: MoxR family ATPase [Bacteroidales bacterium]|nr:MoxR family ATPase [Bacteroidales bacterium]